MLLSILAMPWQRSFVTPELFSYGNLLHQTVTCIIKPDKNTWSPFQTLINSKLQQTAYLYYCTWKIKSITKMLKRQTLGRMFSIRTEKKCSFKNLWLVIMHSLRGDYRETGVSEEKGQQRAIQPFGQRRRGEGAQEQTAWCKPGPELRSAVTEAQEPGSWHNCPVTTCRLYIQGATDAAKRWEKQTHHTHNYTTEKRMIRILKRGIWM